MPGGVALTSSVARPLELPLIHPSTPPFAPLFITSTGAPLTCSFALRALDECLQKAGYNSTEFFGHSFHRSAAFAAAEAGYSPEQIKLLGRWKSDAWKLYSPAPLHPPRPFHSSSPSRATHLFPSHLNPTYLNYHPHPRSRCLAPDRCRRHFISTTCSPYTPCFLSKLSSGGK
ncbi:hypothetical protein DFH08DRAFT_976253 [Mycena albidolilacea]|uniref:Tyr recombinase domain-containing protein n=1 Tax=Mycena albidolilacea TaxID=1033008 RepID=A0AAD6Z3H8_9AGAR|nr:hypothetical protein DFH08DRAFT_976253 [Mycena albidolilacea]